MKLYFREFGFSSPSYLTFGLSISFPSKIKIFLYKKSWIFPPISDMIPWKWDIFRSSEAWSIYRTQQQKELSS